MKLHLLVSLVLTSAMAESDWGKWDKFKGHHQKFYRGLLEDQLRFSIFQGNLRKIDEHNSNFDRGLVTYRLGVNRFADLSEEEFRSMLTFNASGKSQAASRSIFEVPEEAKVPTKKDWRDAGAVTPIKDQGTCGGCWSFSVTGSLEGQYFIKHGELVSFSEQNLIDCAGPKYGLAGCDGGQLDPAFEYIRDHGIEREADYPYEESDEDCRQDNSKVVTRISSYVDVRPNSEKDLEAAVGLVGPVSVAIDASSIQLYESGVYSHSYCSPDDLNHGVLVVGYGTERGVPYWVVKNSWGESFGEGGYIRMRRGVNQCGIAVQPSYPVL
ncbi:procathepsin L-like [Cylas formicarius]|uniref:procathepsin L-like n=1 Tax=Cylas formicarius TaxID=197179 RepID=UPI0029584295|nr:procathepsin L-like [Cylas formicarius]